MFIGFKEIGCAWGTTAMAAYKFVESNPDLVMPKKSGKMYKISPGHARNIFKAKNLTLPKKTIAIENLKGGVGKTSSSHSMASISSLFGFKTLAIDCGLTR